MVFTRFQSCNLQGFIHGIPELAYDFFGVGIRNTTIWPDPELQGFPPRAWPGNTRFLQGFLQGSLQCFHKVFYKGFTMYRQGLYIVLQGFHKVANHS